MGKTLYLDCTNGISGDMAVAALIDAGANEARLRDALATLSVGGYEVRVGRVSKAGLDCCDFDVVLDAEHENHDHDMAYLHGGGASHVGEHAHEHEHEHEHEHGCHGEAGHHHHGSSNHGDGSGRAHRHDHHHEHRAPGDLDRMIDACQLAPRARDLAHRMVDILAHAEAKAHGVALDEVHFHEVGAVDSIVDIVSVAVCLDDLDVTRVIVPRLVDGRGTIRCQHGIIPVPVPATLNIVEAHGLSLSICDVEGELVTPTGAAIVAAVNAERELPARFCVKRVGLGAGKRAYERPSILRAMVIEELPADGRAVPEGDVSCCPSRFSGDPAAGPTVGADAPERIVRLECDIDDATGEQLAYAAERVREAGAREVHWVPVFTKKERPAWQLQVVAAAADVDAVERAILLETTTIGVRRWACERTVLAREACELETPWGVVRAKRVELPDGTSRVKPEFADCAAIARREGIPLQRVVSEAGRAAR